MSNENLKLYTAGELKSFIKKAVQQAVSDLLKSQSKKQERDRLLSGGEVAKRFRVTRQTLRNWERSGLIRPIRVNRRVYYSESALEAFVKSRMHRS